MEPRDDLVLRILRHLGARGATPEQLHKSLGLSAEEIAAPLDRIVSNAWVSRGAAWYGPDPSGAIEVLLLTPAGREELHRRDVLDYPSTESVVVTRAELIEELERRGFPREQLESHPTLRASRYHFWPSIAAYASIQDAD